MRQKIPRALFLLFAPAFVLLAAAPVPAQSATVDATRMPPGTVSLADGWREHRGDEPAFASPNFNDRLTFLSDGVVEAQSASGDLFGFDHTRSISTQSAEAIAAAAHAHGQQDDITVLTLQFAPAEVLHA